MFQLQIATSGSLLPAQSLLPHFWSGSTNFGDNPATWSKSVQTNKTSCSVEHPSNPLRTGGKLFPAHHWIMLSHSALKVSTAKPLTCICAAAAGRAHPVPSSPDCTPCASSLRGPSHASSYAAAGYRQHNAKSQVHLLFDSPVQFGVCC